MTDCFKTSDIAGAMRRAIPSTPPPAPIGTISEIGRLGKLFVL
jgi:hypothetical protein